MKRITIVFAVLVIGLVAPAGASAMDWGLWPSRSSIYDAQPVSRSGSWQLLPSWQPKMPDFSLVTRPIRRVGQGTKYVWNKTTSAVMFWRPDPKPVSATGVRRTYSWNGRSQTSRPNSWFFSGSPASAPSHGNPADSWFELERPSF